jgi:hypothetical protein
MKPIRIPTLSPEQLDALEKLYRTTREARLRTRYLLSPALPLCAVPPSHRILSSMIPSALTAHLRKRRE